MIALYLDDDIASPQVERALRQAGFDLQTPADVGKVGAHDAVHLSHAAAAGRVLVTRNYKDFPHLHQLVVSTGGHHAGVVLVRRDDDPRRNMKPHHIFRALGKLIASGVVIADDCIILNQWR